MNKLHIEVYERLTTDLSQLKCFRINLGHGPAMVKVEYKMFHEYAYSEDCELDEVRRKLNKRVGNVKYK